MYFPARKQNRLTEYDYCTANAYFITICTINRRNLFWENPESVIRRPQDICLTSYGAIVKNAINEIPIHYPAISVDNYAVMPNHVHLLLQIHSDRNGRSLHCPAISTVIRMLKGVVSKQIGFSIWQKSFYDHVVRGDKDYQEIWNYIEGNPLKWSEDKLYQ